jgi:hypothetical protein
MAELLIKLEEADKPDDLLAWGKGHVVCVKPDGHKWGRLECPPKFCVVRVSDQEAKDLEIYLEPGPAVIRKYKIDVDHASLSEAKSTGLISVTKDQMKDAVKWLIKL